MPGTRSGGLLSYRANISKDPDYYKKLGRKGGMAGRGHKFAHGKLDPVATGKLGKGIERRPRNATSSNEHHTPRHNR